MRPYNEISLTQDSSNTENETNFKIEQHSHTVEKSGKSKLHSQKKDRVIMVEWSTQLGVEGAFDGPAEW